jgi:hypothetical protein
LAGEATAAANTYGVEQDKVRKQLADIRGAWESGIESRRAGMEAANVAKKNQLEAEGKGKYVLGQSGVNWQQALTPEVVARLNALSALTGTGQTFKEGEYGTGGGVIGLDEGQMDIDRRAAELASTNSGGTAGISAGDATRELGMEGAARALGAGVDLGKEVLNSANPLNSLTPSDNVNRFQNIRKKWRI